MYEKEEKNFLEKFIDTGKYLIKRQVKRAFRKLMKILLPFIGGFLLIFFAAFIVLGAAESFGDAVKDMVQGSPEHSDKSQAAINRLMDDSEQMYQLIMDDKIDLSALSFAMLPGLPVFAPFWGIF